MLASARWRWRFLSGARPDIVTQNGNLAKSNIDLRFYALKGPLGSWVDGSILQPRKAARP